MRQFLVHCDTLLFRVLSGLCVLLLLVMLGCVGLQVVMRYGFNAPLVWSEELARFTMVWLALLASTIVMRRGQHIAMTDVLPIPSRLKRPLRLAVVIASVAILSALVIHGWELSERTMRQRSSGLGLPMGYMYVAIPVSALLMIVGQVLALARGTSGGVGGSSAHGDND